MLSRVSSALVARPAWKPGTASRASCLGTPFLFFVGGVPSTACPNPGAEKDGHARSLCFSNRSDHTGAPPRAIKGEGGPRRAPHACSSLHSLA